MYFLQSDIQEFTEKYAATLDDRIQKGEVDPAFEIFERYLVRLKDRTGLVKKLLKEKYDFSAEEQALLRRDKEPWPKDEAEAGKLWKQRIKSELLEGRLNKEKEEEVIKRVTKRHDRVATMMQQFDDEEVVQLFLTSLAHAYDPHSEYMGPTEANNFNINNITLQLSGIGARLRWDDGFTMVDSLMPGGPADLSKEIKPKDKIVAVAQGNEEPVDVVEMPLKRVVELIRGKRGTEVRLTVIPGSNGSQRKIIKLTRDEIKITEQLAKAKVVDFPDYSGKMIRIGVIDLPQFYQDCADHVDKLIVRLKKENVAGIVLDLRLNGGGILDQAVELTGLFLNKGPVVQVKDSFNRRNVLKDEDGKAAYDGPLIVLVGKMSASASEIVAAALQDYGRALIVGHQSTHGKGTVQTLIRPDRSMKDSGELKFTVSKFYRIAGGTTQRNGVTPDIILPSVYDYMELGEASLPNCLPADSTQPLDYTKVERVKPFLAELLTNAKSRIEKNPEFKFEYEAIEIQKKRKEDKRISLNEQKRLKEIEENKVRLEARKKQRGLRLNPKEKVFVLDLDAAVKGNPLLPYDPKKARADSGVSLESQSDQEKEDELELLALDTGVDPHLEETLNILSDYTRMLTRLPDKSTEKLVNK